MHVRISLFLLVMGAEGFLCGCGDGAPSQTGTTERSVADGTPGLSVSGTAREVVKGINLERKAKGLPGLIARDDLAGVAASQNQRLIRLGRLTHQDRHGTDVSGRLDRAGVTWVTCGENVGRNRGFDDPGRVAINHWLNSPGHRRNILQPEYTHTGVAHETCPRTGYHYFTQVFVGVTRLEQ